MPVPEHVHRFWRALDGRMGQVEPTWWGAVVTSPAFPDIWDANYARVDVASAELRLGDVADALLPALGAIGTDVFHVVSFHPEETAGLLSELSTLGHTLTFDLVMDLQDEPRIEPSDAAVQEIDPRPAFWDREEASLALFGVEPPIAAQLRALEESTQASTGKRWFGVHADGIVVAMAALLLLDGIGYLDNVITFPDARGRGYATAIGARAIAEGRAAGAEHLCLLTEPGNAPVVRMYERLGFRQVGMLAATRGPVATIANGTFDPR